MGSDIIRSTKFESYSILEFTIEEFDFMSTPKISERFNQVLQELNFPNIILDLHNLNYIDSMGLSILINISKKLKDNSSEMIVVCNSSKILQLFYIAQLYTFFKIFSTIDDATGYFFSNKEQ
jgi:anti-sigma B factor antagonist